MYVRCAPICTHKVNTAFYSFPPFLREQQPAEGAQVSWEAWFPSSLYRCWLPADVKLVKRSI